MRRSFYLTTICGTALALSAPALAQNAKPSEKQDQTLTTQPRNATNTDAQSILRRLEGLWSIEVRVNEALWNMKGVERDNWSNRNDPNRLNTNRNDPNNRPIDKNRPAESDRTQPGADRPTTERSTSDRTTTDRSTTNRPTDPTNSYDGSQPVQSRTMHGAADTSLIMDGKILRERAFIDNTMDASSSASNDKDRKTGAARIKPSNSMNTLSFISFDEGSGTYSAVFMSSKDGMMHFDSGKYDASRNRIVFEGRQDRHDSVYHGQQDSNRDGQIRDGFIEDSYPGKSVAPSSTDRDRNDPNAVNPRPSDPNRTDRDDDGRTTTDRNTPKPIDGDRTTTDRTTKDRNTTDRTNQPEKVQPVREGEKDEKPYWEGNSPDDRKPGATQPNANRPSNNRSGLNPGDDYVVVPTHGQNVRVVLELLSNDQYRVTMYEGGSVEWSDSTTDRVIANPTNRDNTNTNRDTTNRPGTTTQPDAKGVNNAMLAGNVVYQATFTRASGADATAYRQMFDANNR